MSCRYKLEDKILPAIEDAEVALRAHSERPWVIAFSGGKDSTAILRIMLAAAKRLTSNCPKMYLIYCDTRVENPLIDKYVKNLLLDLRVEFDNASTPVEVIVLSAPVADSFFVKVIGRGYPTPTNSFRWCTKGLRIKPVERFLDQMSAQDPVVVLGLRRDESEQRRRTLASSEKWGKQKEGKLKHDIYMPILDFSVSDVWDAIFVLPKPASVEPKLIESIYWDASGECPIIREPNSTPCASGRFGCWTCTVVRKDRSAIKLIEAGHEELAPFLEFRNWIASFRSDLDKRWPERRNGRASPGPFTISARKEILERVRALEVATDSQIITADEASEIERLWTLDFHREKELQLA